jgi:hypothetical protein
LASKLHAGSKINTSFDEDATLIEVDLAIPVRIKQREIHP